MLGAAAACKVKNPICGCTTATLVAGGPCECVASVFKMSLSISYKNPTIYVARDAWTPMWFIRRHEQGHFADHMRVLQTAKVVGEALEAQDYPNRRVCERAVKSWKESLENAIHGARRGRDFLIGRLCR